MTHPRLSLRALGLASALLAGPACVGKIPSHQAGGDPDAAPILPTPDAAPGALALEVSGTVMDYEGAMLVPPTADPVEGATLATDGLTPPIQTTSAAGGLYSLAEVPPGSVFFVGAQPAAGLTTFRPTTNESIKVAEASLPDTGIYLVSTGFVSRNYTSVLGALATPVAGTAIAMVDLYTIDGLPLPGVAVADVALLDGAQAPVTGLGPYFVGPDGTMTTNAQVPTSVLVNGKTRAGFLDLPPGTYTLQVTYLDLANAPVVVTTSFTTLADGATLVKSGGDGPLAPAAGALTFTADVYPDLQRASKGGLSCALCHTKGGQEAALQFDLPAADTYALVMAAPGVVNLASPALSLLLVRPLYDVPPDHPNATFANPLDPHYLKWMAWIQQGAPL